ncbi:DUF4194 domain-containing protein [Pseudomonas tremae]|uniref:DUF4194 domain-containing protein n=1 Tax=Pseudomonas syringae group TaxID=136849 RepID=UPI0001AF535B|nr:MULTISPECIES: DUF4194 domain-containing protein [Pseudomonas syringae group]MCQ3014360.1 DUF4194 domain-containing protein [Pseudomonas tremae]QGL57079.1 DUF4194 domain-containing protein [Pseudomonas coronafaciens pv. oryzae str. 1_6]RMM30695.1 hypothetical protein ALQ80_04109 [Pseudomonas coronafaciens pv. oryzae]
MNREDQNNDALAPSLFDTYRQVAVTALADTGHREEGLAKQEEPGELDEVAVQPESQVVYDIMPAEARRALRLLLNTGVVRAEKKRLAFEALCQHRALIAAHLANMLLCMTLDQKAGIAILLEQDLSESGFEDLTDEDGSSLVGKRTMPLYDTLVLLVLRKYYQEREVIGENKVMIDVDTIAELMTPFLKLTNSSALERKTLNGSIAKLREKRLLANVRGDGERLEITPVIRYVVNADFLNTLLSEYQLLAERGSVMGQQEVEDDV